ncbi:sodium/hydrogen exchanger [Oceanithermus profundus DSM 14977]|uniref:Sodium/hydrogen exchanger n=1 Tax=Oceanithermus profundus (strain DSM 14977 / NBRC 100410 / VKM B-2274 / 506) TaxID=670487 RepID=E4U6G8_OCEP5|nr:cation:proton antiporter [Oceanithermus profundus]ADR35654.1 sodium/hydrogen exchanger [Oceanithermus profundus DSM 14977]
MEALSEILVLVGGFFILALAANTIGQYVTRYNLPLISGFLFAGILIGPYVLGMITPEELERLRFVDEMALAFIAFAAGAELYLGEVRPRLRPIAVMTAVQTFTIALVGAWAAYHLFGFIPDLGEPARRAVALMTGVVLVARSPSSTIAIINELRAKGPFTQLVLGVTVVTDVVVIVLFTLAYELALVWVHDRPLGLGFLLLLAVEIAASVALGYLLAAFFRRLMATRLHAWLKGAVVLAAGYGIFAVSHVLRATSDRFLHAPVTLEPLLIGMIASFLLVNYTGFRDEFSKILEDLGPAVYIAFFTLTGAGLALDVLGRAWPIALALFAARMVGIFSGSFLGALLAREPLRHAAYSGLAFVTQAGVALGLTKKVADEFTGFGEPFAAVIVGLIVLNQLVGPPLFKWSLLAVGEAHPRGHAAFDGVRDVILFGDDDQTLTLARRLTADGWQVRLATPDPERAGELAAAGFPVMPYRELDEATLAALEAEGADAVVCLLSDAENHRICETFYEKYGTESLVVRLADRSWAPRFQELGALVVDPNMATLSLLEQFVRAPQAASLLLGLEKGKQVVDIELRDPTLHGALLRELRLPPDTLVLAIHRDGQAIVTHGYTQLRLGDKVTVMGSPESLREVELKFAAAGTGRSA